MALSEEQLWETLGVTDADRAHFAAQGKPEGDVTRELAALAGSARAPLQVQAAARYDNGFLYKLDLAAYQNLLAAYEARVEGRELAVFVPAAGAASRQFQMLKTIVHHPALQACESIDAVLAAAKERSAALTNIPDDAQNDASRAEAKQLTEVSKNLRRFWDEGITAARFAFVGALKDVLATQGHVWEEILAKQQVQPICKGILSREEGLGYGWLPKALLAFHAYPQASGDVEARTALEEHVRALVRLNQGPQVRLHLAISEEHEAPLRETLTAVMASPTMGEHLSAHDVSPEALQIDWGFQAAATDSVALDIGTQALARRPDGTPLMRKAGHGALIENIAALAVDGIWIQNIDNILYENPAPCSAVHWTKQLMASLGFQRQQELHSHIKQLQEQAKQGNFVEEDQQRLCAFATNELTLTPQDPRLQPESLAAGHATKDVIQAWIELFDRPLVIAGYVPLRPEQKGGGPFVLAQDLGGLLVHKTNTVEGAEFEGGQSHPLFQSGICFNPVNLFIATGRHDGSRFNLTEFADDARFFSSQKSDATGRPIQVYERPGLWNGALAKALQISIGILANTFSAVKDVAGPESFLSPLHQPGDEAISTPLDRQRGIVDDATAAWLQARVRKSMSKQTQE